MRRKYRDTTFVPGHGKVSNKNSAIFPKECTIALNDYLDKLESMALEWKRQGFSEEAIESAEEIPDSYREYRFKGLYPSNLKTAYQQITMQ